MLPLLALALALALTTCVRTGVLGGGPPIATTWRNGSCEGEFGPLASASNTTTLQWSYGEAGAVSPVTGAELVVYTYKARQGYWFGTAARARLAGESTWLTEKNLTLTSTPPELGLTSDEYVSWHSGGAVFAGDMGAVVASESDLALHVVSVLEGSVWGVQKNFSRVIRDGVVDPAAVSPTFTGLVASVGSTTSCGGTMPDGSPWFAVGVTAGVESRMALARGNPRKGGFTKATVPGSATASYTNTYTNLVDTGRTVVGCDGAGNVLAVVETAVSETSMTLAVYSWANGTSTAVERGTLTMETIRGYPILRLSWANATCAFRLVSLTGVVRRTLNCGASWTTERTVAVVEGGSKPVVPIGRDVVEVETLYAYARGRVFLEGSDVPSTWVTLYTTLNSTYDGFTSGWYLAPAPALGGTRKVLLTFMAADSWWATTCTLPVILPNATSAPSHSAAGLVHPHRHVVGWWVGAVVALAAAWAVLEGGDRIKRRTTMPRPVVVLVLGVAAAVLPVLAPPTVDQYAAMPGPACAVGAVAAMTAGMSLLVELAEETSKARAYQSYARALFGEGWMALAVAGGMAWVELVHGDRDSWHGEVVVGVLLMLGMACLALAKRMHSRSYVQAQRADKTRTGPARVSKFVTERKPNPEAEVPRRPPNPARARITMLKRVLFFITSWVVIGVLTKLVHHYGMAALPRHPQQPLTFHGHGSRGSASYSASARAVKKVRR